MFADNFVKNILQWRSLWVFVICILPVEESSWNKVYLGDISPVELSNLEPASVFFFSKKPYSILLWFKDVISFVFSHRQS